MSAADCSSDVFDASFFNKLDEIMALGCTSSQKMMLAYQTWEELEKIENLTDIVCRYGGGLDFIYLVGNRDGSVVIYVPVHSSSFISPSWIECVQFSVANESPDSVVLVIRDADSNFVHYDITPDMGLSPVDEKEPAKANASQSSQCRKRKRCGSMDLDFVD